VLFKALVCALKSIKVGLVAIGCFLSLVGLLPLVEDVANASTELLLLVGAVVDKEHLVETLHLIKVRVASVSLGLRSLVTAKTFVV
jgi:hypothetical protein